MCEMDTNGKGRPPPLPRKKCSGPEDSAVAFEGTDIQALLDQCDSVQGKWDEDGTSGIGRKVQHSRPRNTSTSTSTTRLSEALAADSVRAKSMDDDLVVVDLVTEEGKEMEDALLEMKAALAQAKGIVEDEDDIAAQSAPGPVAASSLSHPLPDQRSVDAQRQKFQSKLRELTLSSGFGLDATRELSDRALLDAARQSLLQDDMPIRDPVAVNGSASSSSNGGRSGNMLCRSSGKAQLPRNPSLDSVLRSCPGTSQQISRPGSGRASVSSLSVGSASRPESGRSHASSASLESTSKTPTASKLAALHRRFGESNAQARVEKYQQLQKEKREVREKAAMLKEEQRKADKCKGEELQKKSAQNVAARCKVDRDTRAIDEEEQELEEARRIIQTELIAAQRETSEKRVRSEKARQAAVLNEVLSSVKDAQRIRQEVSMQKACKLQQRCETQDWEDCRPQNSNRRDRSRPKGSYGGMATHKVPQEAAAMGKHAEECSRSPTDLTKLPRLHVSRSAPAELLKKPLGEGNSLSLPQIPKTRSWLGAAASSQ